MRKYFFLFLFISQFFYCSAQKDSSFVCGSDYSKLSKEEQKVLDQIEKAYLSRRLSNILVDSTSIYTIPVVFHVFHLGEPVGMGSNVSEEYIQNQVKFLNDAYRARAEYYGKSKDTKIQFILSSRDPNGLTSNGIVRIDGRVVAGYEANGVNYNDFSPFGVHYNLTYLSQWNLKDYININIFWKITGAGAFASYNGSLSMPIDNFLDFSFLKKTYTHEMGHSLNLYHTFEGDNNNSNCPPNLNPLQDGDRVSDTQPHKISEIYEPDAINPCTNEVFGELSYNYMSYYNFSHLFSKGQIERMRSLSFEENTRMGLLTSDREIGSFTCNINFTTGYTNFTYLNLTNFLGKNYGYLGSLGSGAGPNGIVGNGPQLKLFELIEVNAGNSYPISLSFFSNLGNYYPQGRVKIYLDKNKDGLFDENTEVLFSPSTYYNITGNIIIPQDLDELAVYNLRIIASPIQTFTSCNLVNYANNNEIYIGNAVDFQILVKSSTCNSIIIPPSLTCSKISKGNFAIIKGLSCQNGMIHWYSDSQKQDLIGKGITYFTPALYSNKTYYAACKVSNCFSVSSEIEVLVNPEQEQVTIETKIINPNTSTTLTALGCQGTVKWYNQEFEGVLLSTGNTFQTPVLIESKTYFAECNLTDGFKLRNRSIGKIYVIQNGIVAKNQINVSFCNSGYFVFYPIQSKTTPTYGPYTILILKNQNLLFERTLGMSGMDLVIDLNYDDFQNSGEYQYYVTNGKMISNMGTIIVSKGINNLLTVNNIPNNFGLSICPGSTNTIKVIQNPKQGILGDDSGLTYTWYKDNVAIPNSNIKELTINSTGQYSVLTSNKVCSTTNTLPVYNSQYFINRLFFDFGKEEPFCAGQNIQLNSEYNSNNASYKWYKNNILLPQITSNIEINSSGLYKLEISENGCEIVNTTKSVQFESKVLASLKIDHITESYYDISLISNADRNNSIIEWYYNSNLIKTENLKDARTNAYSSLGILTTTIGDDGLYYAKLKSGNCETQTNSVRLTSSKTIDKPIVKINSISCGAIQLIAMNNSLTGKWYKDGVVVAANTGNITITQPGVYKYESNINNKNINVSEDFVISNIGNLEIESSKSNLCGANDVIYLRTKYYLVGFTYQWKKNGQNIQYATNSSYTVRDPGSYTLTATSGTCIYTSSPLNITVNNNSPVLTTTDNTQKWCTNSSIQLKLANINSNIVDGITWLKNGLVIPNASGLSLFVNQPGIYSASLNQFGCSGTSTGVNVTFENPIFNLIPSGTLNVGQSAILSIQNCSGIIRWYENEKDKDPLKIGEIFNTPILFKNTKYYVSCEENDCISDRIQAQIVVCNSSLNLSGVIASGTYRASDFIESNINVPSNTVFQAAKKIILKPGFQAGANEVFEAVIGGCEN